MVIVAAVDRTNRSASVTREADKLAKAFDDTIHIVHVISRSEFVSLGRTEAQSGDAIRMDEVIELAEEFVEEAAEGLDSPFETVGLMGDPAPEIVEYADEQDARYIVTSGRKRSPTGKAIFGSTSQEILLNADCAVVSIVSQISD